MKEGQAPRILGHLSSIDSLLALERKTANIVFGFPLDLESFFFYQQRGSTHSRTRVTFPKSVGSQVSTRTSFFLRSEFMNHAVR